MLAAYRNYFAGQKILKAAFDSGYFTEFYRPDPVLFKSKK